ncbi:MAG: hypothetical protein ACFBSG_14755 [Leptolyngbyaceae cyanobacterium]
MNVRSLNSAPLCTGIKVTGQAFGVSQVDMLQPDWDVPINKTKLTVTLLVSAEGRQPSTVASDSRTQSVSFFLGFI